MSRQIVKPNGKTGFDLYSNGCYCTSSRIEKWTLKEYVQYFSYGDIPLGLEEVAAEKYVERLEADLKAFIKGGTAYAVYRGRATDYEELVGFFSSFKKAREAAADLTY